MTDFKKIKLKSEIDYIDNILKKRLVNMSSREIWILRKKRLNSELKKIK